MAKEEKKEKDQRLSRLMGAAAGVTTEEARRIPRMAQIPLSILTELGIEPYSEYTHGLGLDWKTSRRAEKVRAAMGAPRVPIFRGPEHATLGPQAAESLEWLARKFPNLLGSLEGAEPWIMAESPNLAAIAHEMGHTKRSPIAALSLHSPWLRLAALTGGLGAALSESETAQDVAPFIAGAGTLPELLEEGRASAHAIRGIGKAEGAREALKAVGKLAPAWGTYAAGAVPAILAPIVATAVWKHLQGQDKEAAAKPKPVQIKTEGLKRTPITRAKAYAPSPPKPRTSKPGKIGDAPAKPPSKAAWLKEQSEQIRNPQKGTRFAVKQAALGGVAYGFGTKAGANLLAHAIMNTKASPKVIRTFFENIGNEFMKAGFRHALTGKKVSSGGPGGLAIGTVGGAAPMMMYNQGHEYGSKVYDLIKKIPLVKPKHPFKLLRAADVAASGAAKSAPYTGLAAGGTYGYLTGRTKKEKVPIKAIAAGALTGGLMGKGVKHFAPQAPPMKQLKWVRQNIAEPALTGSESRIGKLLDKMAK